MRMAPAFILALAATMTAGAAPAPKDQPVMLGGTDELDACPATAQVTGLKPNGDNFLSVRSRPAATGRELDRLKPDQLVWACDETRDGNWTGVVYSPAGQDIDCNVGTPIRQRGAYRGRCRAGWVSSRFLTIVAG